MTRPYSVLVQWDGGYWRRNTPAVRYKHLTSAVEAARHALRTDEDVDRVTICCHCEGRGWHVVYRGGLSGLVPWMGMVAQ